jgi:hypothetical protein
MKFTLIAFGGLWLFFFLKGNFLHDKAKANDVALLTEVKIFRDLKFQIVQKEKLSDGSYRLVAEYPYQGKPAGLEILIGAKWEPNPAKEKKAPQAYQGRVTLRSLGPESDRLGEMLNDFYLTKLRPKPMAKEINFNVLTEEGDPLALEKLPMKMDLFYEGKNEDRYAEFYINIDWPQDILYFLEKDTDYRKPLLLALRGE